MAGPDEETNNNNNNNNNTNSNVNNNSSFSRLLDTSAAPNRNGGLRRRGSLFGDLPSRQSSNDEAATTASAFSLSSMLQTTASTGIWQKRRQKRRRNSSFSMEGSSMYEEKDDEEERTDSASSASRSLFAPTTTTGSTNPMKRTMSSNTTNAHTICNTQDVYTNTNTNTTSGTEAPTLLPDTPNKKMVNTTTITNIHSSTPKASGRTSLFGSVMQQVGNKESTMTPLKQQQQQQQTMMTPLVQRGSVFSPPKRATEAFGTPGGFQLLDFVNTFASPFSNKDSNNSNHSNMSAANNSKEWNNASLDQGFMDWSLPESLRLDCHPAVVVNPILQTKPGSGHLGLMKFLQPTFTQNNTNNTGKGNNNEGLAEWEAGLLYWQHPAVYPSPFLDSSSKANKQMESKTASKADAEAATKESDRLLRQQQQNQALHAKKKRRATLDIADTKLVQETNNMLSSAVEKPSLSSLQRQKAKFARNRRLEWQQAFNSLYWKWVSQLQENAKNKGMMLEKAYFYARGEDHTVLFRGDLELGRVVPKIFFTSSSASFRRKLLQSGVEAVRLTEAWNGHSREAIFKEEMIRQGKAPSSSKGKPQPTFNDQQDPSRKENTPQLASHQPHSSPLKQNRTGVAKAASTPSTSTLNSESNSPFVKAELAALRRAQVFGETVGADVSVAIKPKVLTGPKLSLGSCPPLFVSGWDDCAAFFEVYLNIGTCCCIPSTREYAPRVEATGEDDEAKPDNQPQKAAAEQSTAQPQVDWQWRHDVPLLVCRGMGPFTHATMKSLVVRGTPQYGSSGVGGGSPNNPEYASLEIQGGPILPCAMFDLFRALAQTMISDQNQRPAADIGMNGEEDALVGSHSLILRALPAVSERQAEELVQKHGVIGLPSSSYLNNRKPNGQEDGFEAEDGRPDQIPHGKMIGTAVWDILHPDAMAYKLESVAQSTSPLSLLLKPEP